MVDKDTVLTWEGLKKLEAELEQLKTVKRKEIADRIRDALDFGDAWENPEYDSAKNEQAFVEGRILTLETLLRNAKVIEEKETHDGVVSVGNRVRLRDLDVDEEVEYVIVGSAEADPAASKISNRSPMAQAILGKREGDTVQVEAPAGAMNYKILEIMLR